MLDLIIKGNLWSDPHNLVEIGIADERIVAIATAQGGYLPEARERLDIQGALILPGLIDAHVHFRAPGLTHKEDFLSGSKAALAGGVTTIIDMPNTIPPTVDLETFQAKRRLGEEQSLVDFGLIVAVLPGNIGQLREIAAAGATGFKVFMGQTTGGLASPSDGLLLAAMREIAACGMTLSVHAENDLIIGEEAARLRGAGRRDPLAHNESRPPVSESEAIGKAIELARTANCPLHILHLSTKEGLELVRMAKGRGQAVSCEVTPHHLFLSTDDVVKRGNEGIALRVNPPLRTPEHLPFLWEGLRDGTIDMIATDHAPHTDAEKNGNDIWQAASGLNGVETSAQLFLTAIGEGRLSLERYVDLASFAPGRIWKLTGKGSLKLNASADLTLVDPLFSGTIEGAALHGRSHLTPYEGWPIRGSILATVRRGSILYRAGVVADKSSRGKYILKDTL